MVEKIRNTILDLRPVDLNDDTDEPCEDCPERVEVPPAESECPYFDNTGNKPVCTRSGSMATQLSDVQVKFLDN